MQGQGNSIGIAPSRRGWVRWLFGGVFILFILLLSAVFLLPQYFISTGTFPSYGRPFFFFPFGFFVFILIFFVGFRLLFWGWGWGHWRRGYYGGYGHSYGDPLEILNQRYARGEITKEQYDQMKRDIQQNV